MNYYNDNDPFAAEFLRHLIAGKVIGAGYVDERSIDLVQPSDLEGFKQCHFFAGIGGWAYALRLAGIDDDARVWTGSCPCQPFSVSGQMLGFNDDRHKWPSFYRLIKQCRPSIVFGEQVATATGFEWLDLVQDDLERTHYAVGSSRLCSAGAASPDIRNRIYFGATEILADANSARLERRSYLSQRSNKQLAGPFSVALDQDGYGRVFEPGSFPLDHGLPGRVDLLRAYGNAINPRVAKIFIETFIEACGK